MVTMARIFVDFTEDEHFTDGEIGVKLVEAG